MGSCHSIPVPIHFYSTFPLYKAAGILFVEGPVALAGIQKYPKVLLGNKAFLSGLGGHRELTDQDWYHTAWREVLEELFHLVNVPQALFDDLRTSLPIRFEPIFRQEYVLLRYNFNDLGKALQLCKKHKITSELYKTMPLTLNELILERCLLPSAEIGALALLPFLPFVSIAPEFSTDLKEVQTATLGNNFKP